MHHRPLRSRWRRGARPGGHPARGATAIGLCLWICVCDAARSCRPRQLGHGEFPVSGGFPILSLMLATPLVAAIACIFVRSEEHTSELPSLIRISYAVFCLKKKNIN